MRICNGREEVLRTLEEWRFAKQRVVMTSGVFDILHRGHLETLSKAREFGDRLLVAINTDESVRRKKGPLRPINCLDDRLYALANLRSVDAVTAFDEPGEQPLELVRACRPDVFVKSGGEWEEEAFPFRSIVEGYGGQAEIVHHRQGLSTSILINRILAQYGEARAGGS